MIGTIPALNKKLKQARRKQVPTIVTHTVVGLAAGKAFPTKMPTRFWVLSAVCPALPDLDVISFALGIPYAHAFGHRGFSHSLFFAALLGLLVTLIFFRNQKLFSKGFALLAGYFFIVTASHGILDAMTNGGLGVALLAPFDNSRYFLPWRPIQVSPIGISRFFSLWGIKVIASELLWVWLPAFSSVALLRWMRRRRAVHDS